MCCLNQFKEEGMKNKMFDYRRYLEDEQVEYNFVSHPLVHGSLQKLEP
jgi:hypothetical protein